MLSPSEQFVQLEKLARALAKVDRELWITNIIWFLPDVLRLHLKGTNYEVVCASRRDCYDIWRHDADKCIPGESDGLSITEKVDLSLDQAVEQSLALIVHTKQFRRRS
jgi:hypothetical protein